ncbi:MAG: helix-turn-helix domain-containing protein [Candidatus Geothermincolia bacterium]
MDRFSERIKSYREAKGISLRAVAEDTGFSLSFLSKLENGKTSITLKNLQRLLQYYGITLPELFQFAEGKQLKVFRREHRQAIESGVEHLVLELLVPDLSRKMEALLGTYEPGARYDMPIHHVGEECVFVIRGEFRLELDGEPHLLQTGDIAYYSSRERHSWHNLGEEEGQLLYVMTPPSF